MSKNINEYRLNVCRKEILNDLTVIHYGHKKYDRKKFLPIRNDNWVKPKGGLWTSPVNSDLSWKSWCHSEEFRVCEESNSFKLKFLPEASVIIIDSYKDLEKLPLYEPSWGSSRLGMKYPDYEKLVEIGIDAIWLTSEGQWKTRLSHPLNLYGWDVETVLVMNKNCCYEHIDSCNLKVTKTFNNE